MRIPCEYIVMSNLFTGQNPKFHVQRDKIRNVSFPHFLYLFLTHRHFGRRDFESTTAHHLNTQSIRCALNDLFDVYFHWIVENIRRKVCNMSIWVNTFSKLCVESIVQYTIKCAKIHRTVTILMGDIVCVCIIFNNITAVWSGIDLSNKLLVAGRKVFDKLNLWPLFYEHESRAIAVLRWLGNETHDNYAIVLSLRSVYVITQERNEKLTWLMDCVDRFRLTLFFRFLFSLSLFYFFLYSFCAMVPGCCCRCRWVFFFFSFAQQASPHFWLRHTFRFNATVGIFCIAAIV